MAEQKTSRLDIVPVFLTEAHAFVRAHHRHHGPSVGGLFAVGCADAAKIIGVAVVGRPVSRMLQDGFTAEVTRLATDGTKNACSMLYAACWRTARSMGYRRLITYILNTESGTSLSAAGWRCVGEVSGRSWSCESRPRVDKHPTQGKIRFEVTHNITK
jgi:hypothetical protein